MSDTEELKAQGFIKLHGFRKDNGEHQPILLNAAHVILMGGRFSIRDTGDLHTTECTEIKAFGQPNFAVKETVAEIAEIIKASGIDVYEGAK